MIQAAPARSGRPEMEPAGYGLSAQQHSPEFLQEAERAYDRTLNFLSYRPRSRAEMERHLRGRKLPDEIITWVMDRLVQARFVDDDEFANYWAANRQQFSPRGDRALRQEMRQKGVDREAIEKAVEKLPDERSRAEEAARRRLRGLRHLGPAAMEQKIVGFLARRGFGYEVARSVARSLRDEVSRGPGLQYDNH